MNSIRRSASFVWWQLRVALAAATAASSCFTISLSTAGEPSDVTSRASVRDGIRVEARVESLDDAGHPLIEEQVAHVSLTITDTTTGRPVSGLPVAAWLDRIPSIELASSETCRDKARNFLEGGLFTGAMASLNRFFVLVLNADGTINVVDPQFEYGGSRLLATIRAGGAVSDWAIDPAGRVVWLAVPALSQLVEVDTWTWKPRRTVTLDNAPQVVALQPGGRMLWTIGGDGVSVVDVESFTRIALKGVGAGPHEIKFSPDGRHAVVTSERDNSASVFDGNSFELVRKETLAGAPRSLDWSISAELAVIADRVGAIFLLDPTGRRPLQKLEVDPGLERLRTSPTGATALGIDPVHRKLYVLDLAQGRVIATRDTIGVPDEVFFSAGLAYIHHEDTERIETFPVATTEGDRIGATPIEIPGGQRPPGHDVRRGAIRPIARVVGENAVLIASPNDNAVFFYKEGLAAPMGSFKNYGQRPRGIVVLDRSLRETKQGTYETVVRLGAAGRYDLVVFSQTPAHTACYPFQVSLDPSRSRAPETPSIAIAWDGDAPHMSRGEVSAVRVRVSDAKSGDPTVDLTDLFALIVVPGRWQERVHAVAVPATPGIYELRINSGEAGIHILFFESRSLGLESGHAATLVTKMPIFETVASVDADHAEEKP